MASFDTFVVREIEQVRALEGEWGELLARSSAAEIFRSPRVADRLVGGVRRGGAASSRW